MGSPAPILQAGGHRFDPGTLHRRKSLLGGPFRSPTRHRYPLRSASGQLIGQLARFRTLLREGLGRPPQAEEAASPRLPRTAEAVEKLGWSEMKMIFATHFASEISAVTEDGDALLRERVGALDEEQRQLLREALDEVKIAS